MEKCLKACKPLSLLRRPFWCSLLNKSPNPLASFVPQHTPSFPVQRNAVLQCLQGNTWSLTLSQDCLALLDCDYDIRNTFDGYTLYFANPQGVQFLGHCVKTWPGPLLRAVLGKPPSEQKLLASFAWWLSFRLHSLLYQKFLLSLHLHWVRLALLEHESRLQQLSYHQAENDIELASWGPCLAFIPAGFRPERIVHDVHSDWCFRAV